MARFNTFREHTLKPLLEQLFGGDDIIWFFDSIDKIKPNGKDKPSSNRLLMRIALGVIIQFGTFTYLTASGHKITSQDGLHISTWIENVIHDKRLIKRPQKLVVLDFLFMSYMSCQWLDHHVNHGTISWDVALAKPLSTVLVTSFGSRAGEIARSKYYTDNEVLSYGDIHLRFSPECVQKAVIPIKPTPTVPPTPLTWPNITAVDGRPDARFLAVMISPSMLMWNSIAGTLVWPTS